MNAAPFTAWSAYGPNVVELRSPVNPDRLVDDTHLWSAREERTMLEMIKYGSPLRAVAKVLGRSYDAVRVRAYVIRNRSTKENDHG